MNTLLAPTPYYVLLEGKQRLSPKLLPLHDGMEYVAIYGFSDKQPYDLFCANCDLPLTPYPLVKGFLETRIADSGSAILLVVMDAEGPQEPQLNAATMNSVLEALEHEASHVSVTYRLTFDRESHAYRVENTSQDLEVTSRPAEAH